MFPIWIKHSDRNELNSVAKHNVISNKKLYYEYHNTEHLVKDTNLRELLWLFRVWAEVESNSMGSEVVSHTVEGCQSLIGCIGWICKIYNVISMYQIIDEHIYDQR